MRRWFVIFLIVLLPWRAWAGDAMTLAVPAPADASPAAHCTDHAAPATTEHHGADHAQRDLPAPHAVCDICNGPVLVPATGLPAWSTPVPHAVLSAGPERFDSALAQPGHKPPIA